MDELTISHAPTRRVELKAPLGKANCTTHECGVQSVVPSSAHARRPAASTAMVAPPPKVSVLLWMGCSGASASEISTTLWRHAASGAAGAKRAAKRRAPTASESQLGSLALKAKKADQISPRSEGFAPPADALAMNKIARRENRENIFGG